MTERRDTNLTAVITCISLFVVGSLIPLGCTREGETQRASDQQSAAETTDSSEAPAGDLVADKVGTDNRAASTTAGQGIGADAAGASSANSSDTKDAVASNGGHGYGAASDIDFIKLNGEIFKDWPKPELAIVFSGAMDGYIEPCGCAGLEKKKGGLGRRDTLIRQLRQDGWPLVMLDMGGLVKRLGPQAAIKYQRIVESLLKMDYQAIGLGVKDLRLPTQELLVAMPQNGESPFVSANVASIFDEDYGFRLPYKVIEEAGKKIGVTSVLGAEKAAKLQNQDFTFTDPAEALTKVVPQLEAENCDHLILLANATSEAALALAEQFKAFDMVVIAGDSDPPAPETEELGGGQRLVELSHKSMYVGVLGFFDDPQQPFRYQRVPLDVRFPESERMVAMMTSYQQQLESLGYAGLGLQPNPHPTDRAFVGSDRCGECHDEAYEIWKESPHSHALETLVDLKPARHFDPECLSCHVTGWAPQGYYPFESGYLSLQETPHLYDNGCENCHGPGSHHVAAEEGDLDVSDDEIEKIRASMRLTLAEARKNDCGRCHDLDNSPDFDFDTYWPEIEH